MTSTRPLEIAAFLDRQRWGEAQGEAFDADFSPRRYMRLTQDTGKTAILMDADTDQKTPEFIAVANILRRTGLLVPEIYVAHAEQGLVLMQDLGTRNVGALLDAGESPLPFFLCAAEVLARLHCGFEITEAIGVDLPLYNVALFTTQAELFLDAYFPFATQRDPTDEERQDFCAAWQSVLHPLDLLPKSLLLRDFMPDNLMDVPQQGLGVLDFQDAGIGPTAYDLASLCEEVRRDGGFALLPEVIAHYLKILSQEGTPAIISAPDLLRACTILSAQRHTRILGTIVRLSMKSGRRDKLAFLPRIRNHLAHILNEPYLFPVQEWMKINNA